MTRTQQQNRRTSVRRTAGVLLALFGVLFVPVDVILSDPEIVPAPESQVVIAVYEAGDIVPGAPVDDRG